MCGFFLSFFLSISWTTGLIVHTSDGERNYCPLFSGWHPGPFYTAPVTPHFYQGKEGRDRKDAGRTWNHFYLGGGNTSEYYQQHHFDKSKKMKKEKNEKLSCCTWAKVVVILWGKKVLRIKCWQTQIHNTDWMLTGH